ncbi:MAG: TetR/AcrR family transcriptional regulator [Clostridiales bacterium]|nr:TetR/AcrR family transcriptional regulator [Clostridiales bacterium]
MKNYKEKEILVFQAAWELFSEKGFHETKISEIAKKAGIGKGTIYEYFSSKEELAAGMIIFNLENAHQELMISISEVESPEDKMRAIGESDIKQGMGIMKTMKILQMVENFDKEAIKVNVFDIMNKRFVLIGEIIAEGIAKGVFNLNNPINGALMFIGTMNNALMVSNFTENNLVNLHEVLDFVIEKLKK